MGKYLHVTEWNKLKEENEKLKHKIRELTHCQCGLELSKGECERCDYREETSFACPDCNQVLLCPKCDLKTVLVKEQDKG